MIILGINAYHPDSSAAIIENGKLIAAAEEERFRRIKHFAGFPSESVKYCLKEAGVSLNNIDYIAIPRQPRARLLKKVFYAAKIPALARHRLLNWKNTFEIDGNIVPVEHHRAHLASSFFVSGFDEAFLFSCDALGDFASCMWGVGEGNKIKVLGEITFPHSLGFYYTAITQYLGFLKFGDEYKVMGLASYGEPSFENEFKSILKIKKNGFELELEYFLHHKKYIDMNFESGYPKVDVMFSPHLEKRLGKRRLPGELLEKRHRDIAASLQKRLEEAILHLLNCHADGRYSALCLAGGVAFNCVANAKILDNTRFKKIYVPPAAGDAGLAVGAAFYVWNQILNKPRSFVMDHAYWGPGFEDEKVSSVIARSPVVATKQSQAEGIASAACCGLAMTQHDENELCHKVAQEIADGKVVGWFQGRMEFGPRALGNRSIVVDPRREEMKDILNKRIKYREPFRPFAPSVLEEFVAEYFEHSNPSPFMSFAYKIREEKKKLIPAVIHADGTARLQTVNKNTNSLYWNLINEFKKITDIPLVLNTSFNENEPIVCSPQEAIDCFLRTSIDILVLGPFIIKRSWQG